MNDDSETDIVSVLQSLYQKLENIEGIQTEFMNLIRNHWKNEAARRRERCW